MSQQKTESNTSHPPSSDRLLKGINDLARKLDQNRIIYPVYSLFDSLNLSYTTFKYFVDMLLTNSSMSTSDAMHDWLLSPLGLPMAVLGTLGLISLSVYKSVYQENKTCDLLFLDEVPTQKNLKFIHLSEKTQQAYVWVHGELYFISQSRGLIKKITLNPEQKTQFLNHFQCSKIPLSLSGNQLGLIQGIAHYRQSNALQDYLAWIWPYVRDVCKAIKSGQKGMRSLVFMISKLSRHSLNYLNLPLAITASILAALLRVWWRRMGEKRVARQEFNKALRESFLEKKKQDRLFKFDLNIFREGDPNALKQHMQAWFLDYEAFLKQIQSQPLASRNMAYFVVTLGAMIDTTYLYVGLVSLAVFVWPAFIAMSILCILFSAIQILVRIYEEYCFQEKLKISILETEICILEAQIESLINALDHLSEMDCNSQDVNKDCWDIILLNEALQKVHKQYKSSRMQLNHIYTKHNGSALLEGLKAGLSVFGAVAAGFFGVSTFMALAGAAFPPALMMSVIAAGVVILIGFTCFTLYKYYQHRKTHKVAVLLEKDCLELYLDSQDLKIRPGMAAVQQLFVDSIIKPAPILYFQKLSELIRSFFSGVAKGLKSIDYTLNPAASRGDDGHYHQTLIMIILGSIAAFIYALVFALYSFVKEFKNIELPKKDKTDVVLEKQTPTTEPHQTDHILIENQKIDLDLTEKISENKFGFFNESPQINQETPRKLELVYPGHHQNCFFNQNMQYSKNKTGTEKVEEKFISKESTF